MKEIQKPMSVVRRELIDGIRYIINDSHLPPYVISPVLKEMVAELDIMTENQYRSDMNEYQRLLQECDNLKNDVNAAG